MLSVRPRLPPVDHPVAVGGAEGCQVRLGHPWPDHHLYVCTADSRELARHLAFRDYLRTHPDQARAYAELKWSLVAQFRLDRDAYTRSKTAFIEQALAAATHQ